MRLTCLTAAFLAAALTSFAQAPSYVPSDGLVAFYPLNGDALDAGPHGLDGTLNGASSIADRNGVAGGALAFDGQDDFIRVQHSAEFDAMASEFTISAWIQNEIWTQPNWLYYVSKSDQLGGWGFNGGFLLRAGADGGGGFGYVPKMETTGGEWQLSSPDPLIDTWEHVAFTFTGDSAHLYRDGQRVASRESLGGDMVLNAFDVIIGAGYEAQDHHVLADMDDIGFWSRALEDEEIEALADIEPDPCMADTEAPSGAANDMLVYLDGDGLAEVDSAGITIFHDDFEGYPLNKTVFNYSDLWEAEPGASFDAKISNWANHTPGGNRSLRLKANGVRVALGNLSTYGSPVNLEYYCTFGSPGGVNGQNSASEITFLDGNGDDLFQYTLDGNEPTEYLDGSWSIEEIQPHQALGQTWQKVNVVFDFDADSATVLVEDIAIAGASGADASLVSQIRIETSGGGWSFFDDFYVKSGMPVSAEDNCGIATIDVLPHLFDCDDLGDAPVSYLITDLSGNTTTVSGTITVEDHIFPSTLAIADTTLILDVNGAASLMAAEVDSSSSDNCGLASLTLSQSQFSCADVDASPLSVVLTGSDASGNSTTDTVLVTLLTNIAVDEVTVLSTPTDLQSANGEIGVSLNQGTAASFALEGLNGSPDYTFVMPTLLNGIAPGYYNVTATDPNGCVSPALPAFVPYELCCACGVHDADSDGICDDEDACTDKTSPNYNDPANLPCE